MWIYWLILLLLCLIAEAVTVNTVTIWFAFGALAALVLDLLRQSVTLQVVLFFVVSGIFLALFLLYFKPKRVEKAAKAERTNADRIIDREGVVLEEIDPLRDKGQILVLGQVWTAVTTDRESIIAKDSKVRVLKLSGVKAVVEPVGPPYAE